MSNKEKESAQCRSTNFKTMCGGQALIEGIMMRGPHKQAVVVRKPDGDLEIQETELKFVKDKYPILGVPFIRGTVNFMDSMINGVKALMFSAEYYPEDEAAADEKPSKFEVWLEDKLGSEKITSLVIALSVFLGVGLSIGLFILLPTVLAGFLFQYVQSYFLRNLIEGALRILIFMSYLIFCSRMKDIQRVFRYHGAEHKTIFCYEAGLPLTVENVRQQPKHHPRCGTSFLFSVMIISILIFSVVQWSNVWVRLLLRLLLLPVVVGISYEFNRYVGKHDNQFTRFMTAPGLWLQNWTTSEPDDSMMEVGIKALELVLPEKEGEDVWGG